MDSSSAARTGVSLRWLLHSASEEALSEFVPLPVRDLLVAIDSNMPTKQCFRGLIGALWTGSGHLVDDSLHGHVIALLPSEKDRELAHVVGIPNGIDLTQHLQAVDFSARQIREKIYRFSGIAEPSRNSTVFQRESVMVTASFDLFDYRHVVVTELLTALTREPRRLVLSAGAGKTRVAMHVVREHLRSHDPDVVLWLAYSRELLDQAASAFEPAWRALGNRDLALVRYWGSAEHDLAGISDGLVVAGLNKLDALADRDYQALAQLADCTALTVMNEAHQSIARTYRQLLDLFATKRTDASLLGLTATPGRTWADIDSDADCPREVL